MHLEKTLRFQELMFLRHEAQSVFPCVHTLESPQHVDCWKASHCGYPNKFYLSSFLMAILNTFLFKYISIFGSFRVRSGSVRDPFGVRSGSIRANFGPTFPEPKM